MLISEFKKKLEYASSNIDDEAGRIIANNQNEIYDLIRKNQLANNEMGDGRSIGYYANDYIKSRINPISYSGVLSNYGFDKLKGSPYNFRWTDGVWNNFLHKYSNFELEIFNIDKKIDKLKDEYGSNLIEMQPENQEILRNEYIYPNITKWLKEIL